MASKQRVICGLSVAAVWLTAIFLLPIWGLIGLVAISSIICLYEYCTMLKQKEYELPFKTMAGLAILYFVFKYLLLFEGYLALGALSEGVLPCIIAVLFFKVLLDARLKRPMGTAALAVAGFFYIPFLLSYFMDVTLMAARVTAESAAPGVITDYSAGIFASFFLALITKMSDTGGYFIGSAFGKHKMCPRLSPGKSWEGTIGGYAFSLIAAGLVLLCAALFPSVQFLAPFGLVLEHPLLIVAYFVLVWIVVTVAIWGDLLESLFKRRCGVKDSSALFPAMGGFFDTFDSVIFIPAITIAYIKLIAFVLLVIG